MVTDEMVEKAVNAALKADIIPADDPKHSGVRINEYLSYTPAEAVELGVQLTQKTEDGKPRWHGFTDIMGDEYDDTNRAILRPVVRAALEAALSAAEPVDASSVSAKAWTQKDMEREYLAFKQWFKEQVYPKFPQEYPLIAENAMHAAWQMSAERSALSAQVQDESEIVDCLLAGNPFVFDPATNFCHADDGGAPEHGIKYVPAAQVQDVAGWQLVPKEATREQLSIVYEQVQNGEVDDRSWAELYAAFIAAAPAKQEG
ncbi:hypothetical protein [Agrobacterium sp. 10MFCol1.1]|uniref:hypothetical protein n=1 Tax=Agrobacterium sp. 10MFCol1.1 TaxID=1150775 RepID=UPI00037DF9A3|nr:hypothetical protein [Agrobacterium sp. 10MFCol1.1]